MDTLLDFFTQTALGHPVWMWAAFLGIVLTLLVFDLGVLNRKDHEIGVRESLRLTGVYVAIALLFGVWVWNALGADPGLDYFTAYLIELSLSIDNLFVISMIFAYYGVPRQYQHRVLFWGIIGVIVMRGILIGVGSAVVHRFEWVLLIFAAFLIFTGLKMLLAKDDDEDRIEDSAFLKFLQKHLRVTPFLHGHKFFVREKGMDSLTGWVATPLFLALVTVEVADLIFAVDSVPAVLAITNNTFVVYTSNIFAVVGLRAMYFAVAAIIHRFHYMKYALAVILMFIGTKAFIAEFAGFKLPPVLSLGITLTLLASGIIFSMIKTRKEAEAVVQAALKGESIVHIGPKPGDDPKTPPVTQDT
ncbi:TerC family protein [Micavibrio aeruginosavorus]|nr:TerC family protein [Micavibrio aeruginosavorus]